MKKIIVLLALIIAAGFVDQLDAQLLKEAKKFVKTNTGSGLSEKDASDGIKEALVKGTGEAVKVVSVNDGYFGNARIKIPFPPDAKVIEEKLRALGMGKKVDEAVLSMNRAAEDAAKDAKPIFVNAITGMSVKDAIGIVKGEKDAATQYLRKTTSPELNVKFQPVIKSSLDKVNATKYWEDLVKTYNKIPMVKKMNPDLTAYVTQKAIDGLFVMVAQEEENIRKNPAARTTELLKKVFGK